MADNNPKRPPERGVPETNQVEPKGHRSAYPEQVFEEGQDTHNAPPAQPRAAQRPPGQRPARMTRSRRPLA
jgi:hypothetical protein